VFRTVIGSYEDRQNMLMSENGDLRSALRDLQKQLIAMLHSDDSQATGEKSAEVCYCNHFTWNCWFDLLYTQSKCWNYLQFLCLALCRVGHIIPANFLCTQRCIKIVDIAHARVQ